MRKKKELMELNKNIISADDFWESLLSQFLKKITINLNYQKVT